MMRKTIVVVSAILLLAGCGDKPTEPEGAFSVSLSTLPPVPNVVNNVIVSNTTSEVVLTDPCPGLCAQQWVDDRWQTVWSAVDPKECWLILVVPGRVEPGSSYIERYGPVFPEPGRYRLGWRLGSEGEPWPDQPYYTEPFEVVAP